MSSATLDILRYVGEAVGLSDLLTRVRLVARGPGHAYQVSCPFCLRPMVEASPVVTAAGRRQQRFACADDHRISLVQDGPGRLGWS